jgi:hypothetical protein
MATALRADIIAHKPNGALSALIEVRNRQNLDRAVAIALRDGLIGHGALPDVPFFFLVSQEKAYLWINRGPMNTSMEPDLELDPTEALKDYIPPDLTGRLHREELESVVYYWLMDLAMADRIPSTSAELELARAGFVDAIRGAILDREIA